MLFDNSGFYNGKSTHVVCDRLNFRIIEFSIHIYFILNYIRPKYLYQHYFSFSIPQPPLLLFFGKYEIY